MDDLLGRPMGRSMDVEESLEGFDCNFFCCWTASVQVLAYLRGERGWGFLGEARCCE